MMPLKDFDRGLAGFKELFKAFSKTPKSAILDIRRLSWLLSKLKSPLRSIIKSHIYL